MLYSLRLDGLDRHLDSFFNDWPPTTRATVSSTSFTEHDDGYKLLDHLPGLKRKDLNVQYEEELLVVEGQSKIEGKSYKYSRVYDGPVNLPPKTKNATQTDGVLLVTGERREDKKPLKVEVS